MIYFFVQERINFTKKTVIIKSTIWEAYCKFNNIVRMCWYSFIQFTKQCFQQYKNHKTGYPISNIQYLRHLSNIHDEIQIEFISASNISIHSKELSKSISSYSKLNSGEMHGLLNILNSAVALIPTSGNDGSFDPNFKAHILSLY